MDSEESYHSESDFYYPNEETNDIEKQTVVKVGNEKNPHEFDVFTIANVQDYILEPNGRKTEYDLNVWKRFFRNIIELREIEDVPADELNIFSYSWPFHDGHKMEDDS